MLANKIKLTDEYIDLIIKKRKEHTYTAYHLSEHIGKNKSWLPNIENRRTKSITKEDFLLIFRDFAEEENMDTETYIIKYLSPNALVELENNMVVPCHHLQRQLELSSQPPALTSYPNQQTEWIQLSQYLSDLNQQIQHIFYDLSEQEKKETLNMLLTMIQNFSCHYKIAKSLYGISIFHSASAYLENKIEENQFLKDISDSIENCSISISFINAKATVYSFFDPTYSEQTLSQKIADYKYGTITELTEILFYIEKYIYAVYDYSNLFYKNAKQNPCEAVIDYQKLYGIMVQFLKDFLSIAELTYPFHFELPSNQASIEEIQRKHLEITNIIFQIRQIFYNKYNSNSDVKYPTEKTKLYSENLNSDIQKEKLHFQKMQQEKTNAHTLTHTPQPDPKSKEILKLKKKNKEKK